MSDSQQIYVARHALTPDVLRTIQSIWECRRATQPGPYERFWERPDQFYADHRVDACENGAAVPTTSAEVYDAVARLYGRRHALFEPEIQMLEAAWCCASAAGYGEPYERFWEWDSFVADLAAHDSAVCE